MNSDGEFFFASIRSIRGQRSSCDSTEWQHSLTEDLVEHLREAGIDRGETAEDSLVSGELFEAGAGICVVADREQEEQNRQLATGGGSLRHDQHAAAFELDASVAFALARDEVHRVCVGAAGSRPLV